MISTSNELGDHSNLEVKILSKKLPLIFTTTLKEAASESTEIQATQQSSVNSDIEVQATIGSNT